MTGQSEFTLKLKIDKPPQVRVAAHGPVHDNPQTLHDLVRFGAAMFERAGLFFGHGTDNASDEALALAAYALRLPPHVAESYLNTRLGAGQVAEIGALYRARVQTRKPAAYLTHEAWFAGLPFYVDERVLVPRSPMAELIGEDFAPWIDVRNVRRVLDLCCGSGCIGIATALALPAAQVDVVDCDRGALDVARRNVERHELQARVQVIHSNLYAALDGRIYDLILCNPPYVSTAEYVDLPAEYRHEPEIGLLSGKDGLEHARAVLAGAGAHLASNGVLVLEVGASQAALEIALPRLEAIWVDLVHGGEGVAVLERDALIAPAVEAQGA